MKKTVSILLSFTIFLSTSLLLFILSIHYLISEKTIHNISKGINYLELVDIKAESGDLKNNYDEFYLSLEKKLSNDVIVLIYKSDFMNRITTQLIYNELRYLFISKDIKILDEKDIYLFIEKEVKKINFSDNSIKESAISAIKNNSYYIINVEKVIRSKIDSINIKYLDIIKYILSYPFRIIILCLLIISIIIEFLINKREYLPYVFVPTTLCCMIFIVFSLFFLNIIKSKMHEFIYHLVSPYILHFSNLLLTMGIITLFISILFLMMNEMIINSSKIVIRPRIKEKNI